MHGIVQASTLLAVKVVPGYGFIIPGSLVHRFEISGVTARAHEISVYLVTSFGHRGQDVLVAFKHFQRDLRI